MTNIKPVRIAVLLTCHNRRDITLKCLHALYAQEISENVTFQVYLVDDGCTDGTGDAVCEQFPDVKILQGDGCLYWCGGMRVAFAEAMKSDFDYYLWLNDDTKLYPNAVNTLLETSHKVHKRYSCNGIIVGSTQDPQTHLRTYGGMLCTRHWVLDIHPVQPSNEPRQCDTMNGNCVLIPKEVARTVGNLSPEFTHAIGDMDYGLRAEANGISCWVCPGFVGTCRFDSDRKHWTDPELPLCQRLKILYSPKGLPPREWILFVRRHAGIIWPYHLLTQQLHVFLPGLWRRLGK